MVWEPAVLLGKDHDRPVTLDGQSLYTGQEFNNSYIITRSPDFAPMPQTRSLLDSMLDDIYRHSATPDARRPPVLDFPSDESPVDLGGSCRYFGETTHACKPQFTVPGDWGSGITMYACALVTCCCAGDVHSQHRFTHLYRSTTDGSASITQSLDCS